MKLAVASGKGGTGKTTVALSLALSVDPPGQLLDCDVEEPNCHLFLKPQIERREPVTVPVPVVDATKCEAAANAGSFASPTPSQCSKAKQSSSRSFATVAAASAKVCPTGAIREVEHEIGGVEEGISNGVSFITGSLHVGQALAPTVIRAVKRRVACGHRPPLQQKE